MMKYGQSEYGGQAYSLLAMTSILVLGNTDEVAVLGDRALAINKNFRGSFSEATALYLTYLHVIVWTNLLQTCVPHMKQAYRSGMRSGNTEFALWSSFYERIFIPFFQGKPLDRILDTCASCASQAEEVRQYEHALWVKMFWQALHNLTGVSDETKLLTGEIFDSENYPGRNKTNGALCNYMKLNLLVIFGDFESAAKFAIQVGNSFAEGHPANFMIMRETFLRGLALYAMAIKTRKFKYKSAAKKIRKTFQTWIKKGNPNVKHYFSLLTAEQAVLDKKYQNAEKHFRDSIVFAARTGHLHDAALFEERYADCLQHGLKDADEANHRISQAIRFYKEWGANAKVDLLQA